MKERFFTVVDLNKIPTGISLRKVFYGNRLYQKYQPVFSFCIPAVKVFHNLGWRTIDIQNVNWPFLLKISKFEKVVFNFSYKNNCYVQQLWNYMLATASVASVLALMPLKKCPIDYKIFQCKCPFVKWKWPCLLKDQTSGQDYVFFLRKMNYKVLLFKISLKKTWKKTIHLTKNESRLQRSIICHNICYFGR